MTGLNTDQASRSLQAQQTLQRQTSARPAIEVWGHRAMVSSMHPSATFAGLDILRAGGHAVDAAVAVGSTLAVTNHNWAGLAGDSAWLIYDSRTGTIHHLDGYSVCPAAMTPDRIAAYFNLNNKPDPSAFREEPDGFRELGSFVSMVPGTPAALHAAWQKFGRLRFEQLLERAIECADRGVVVSTYVASSLHKCRDKLKGFAESRAIFFRDENPCSKGDVLIQKDLADTLRRFARNPAQEFVRGPTAALMLDCITGSGMELTYSDLENYQPVWRQPVEGRYRNRRVVAAAPPTAGLHVIQALNILERVPISAMTYGSADTLHVLIETLKRALADRRRSGGDPDHLDVPIGRLIDNTYAASQADTIDMARARPLLADSRSTAVGTTHFVVIDAEGNSVSATQTIGRDFGCGEVVPGTGLVMNDRSWWMSLGDGPNIVAPGRRASIGHAPTMVLDDDGPTLVLGSPGGFGIVPYVVQTLVNVIDYGFDLQQAIEAPRFRLMDLEFSVSIEDRIDPASLSDLRARGHCIDLFPPWTDRVGGVEGVQRDRVNGVLFAGYDPRRNSYAAGF